ncbi:MAG: fibronectin type III-like domain-contianing protein, partial [Oscillospiraceae bacterium]|nr:fibronectin type III-like domain-contianing protein [Oscillospiraceae bacterium]
GNGYFVHYSEGIYVGYKYFETRHATDESYNYDKDVVFPFGHGLSYTEFEKSIVDMSEKDGTISVEVEVKNIGSKAGKDVIEIYYNPPYTGAVEKSTVNLVAFKKTAELPPGKTETYTIEFSAEDMASYDYVVHNSYVLEQGDYEIMLCENSHTVIDSAVWSLDEDIIFNDDNAGKRATDRQTATAQFSDALYDGDYLTREWDSSSRAFTGPSAGDYVASQEILDAMQVRVPTDAELGLTEKDLPGIGVKLDKTIMLSEMSAVPYDDPKWEAFISQLTLDELINLSGNAGYHIGPLKRLGVPRAFTPDGPSSITASIYAGLMMGKNGGGITYPCPVVIASCWNEEVYYLMGTSVGKEARAIGFDGWYAPAMNTHRLPFDGRNFEYYSEDGVLAGYTAGNVVRGATDQGIICFIKHFALNDRESNCRSQLFTWSNEQAIREIYLKPFEMAVKKGGAMGAMSSFNYIGLHWAGAHRGLLTEVLRGEWGFRGAVISDAAMTEYMSPVMANYAGGNLSLDAFHAMGLPLPNHCDKLKAAANDPDTRIGTTRALYQSGKDILYAFSRTWGITG